MSKYESKDMDSYYMPIVEYEAEQVVIEAAKAWKKRMTAEDLKDTAHKAMFDTVEAMQAVKEEK